MSNYIITGVSSGLGRELTKKLVKKGHRVFGIARRSNLLINLQREMAANNKFEFLCVDLAKESAWEEIITQIAKIKFSPDVVIFNAAIFEKDYLQKKLDFPKMKNSFEVNFFSIIKGFEEISKIAKLKTQFIFISSSSALKGSGAEGIGYPASKAALSSAFESLYQKYKDKYQFKIIYFGPINTTMLQSASLFTPILSKDKAANIVIRTIHSNRVINYAPWYLFVLLRAIKILPSNIYLTILNLIDILHLKSSKK